MAFRESLRMQNIFPSEGGSGLGMPNFNSGQSSDPNLSAENLIGLMLDQKKQDRLHEMAMMDRQLVNRPRLGQIASNMQQPNMGQMDVRFQPSPREMNRDALGFKREELAQEGQIANQKLGLASRELNIDEFKAKNPGLKLDASGPTVIAVDPITGKVIDTGRPTGNLSEREKLAIQHDSAMALQGERGKQKLIEIGAQGNETRKTGDTQAAVNTNQNLQNLRTKTQETMGVLDELLDKNNKLTSPARDATGKSRMFGLQYVPGTQTKKGDVAIKQLADMLTIDLIGEMKAQSRTGATGFGALNMKELGVLQGAATKLKEPGLDEETIQNELIRIKTRLNQIMSDSPSNDGATNRPSAADLIKKYGGE